MFFLILFLFFVFIFFLYTLLSYFRVKKLFASGNVIVTGLRGCGKDLLFSLILNRSRRSYISNVDYTKGKNYFPFSASDISIGGNNFQNFLTNSIIPYDYPHEDGIDYFISDAGVYFPSTEDGLLNRYYPSISLFQALSRHLGDCNFHCNVQNLNRLYLKIREQSDTYIRCTYGHVFFKFLTVIKGYTYDNYDSCVQRRKPMKHIIGKQAKIARENYRAQYGEIKSFLIIKFCRHSYDSRRFKTILKGDYLNETQT